MNFFGTLYDMPSKVLLINDVTCVIYDVLFLFKRWRS